MNSNKVVIKTEKQIVGRMTKKTIKKYVVFQNDERMMAFDDWLIACKFRDQLIANSK